MIKLVSRIRRKHGLSPDEFRDYYEKTHRKLVKHFSHHILDYRRSYPRPDLEKIAGIYGELAEGEDPGSFDVLTEIWFENAEALATVFELLKVPETRAIFEEDEKRFLDRSSIRVAICEECDTCEELGKPAALRQTGS